MSKLQIILDFLSKPMIWITLIVILGSVLGFQQQVKEILAIAQDFLVEVKPW